jgi:hypothetical protein
MTAAQEDEDKDVNAFVAEEAVKPLRYDFRTRANPDGPRGDIPEPSFEKIKKFRKVIGGIIGESAEDLPAGKKVEDLPVVEQVRIIGNYLAKDGSVQQKAVVTAMSELTHIPRPQIENLPYRIQQSFLTYLVNIFLLPSTATGAITV